MVPSGRSRERVSVYMKYRRPSCQNDPVSAPASRRRSAGSSKTTRLSPVLGSTRTMRGGLWVA